MEITDRIEKDIYVEAPRSRVWRAIADAKQFGDWFGVRLEGPWVVGQPMKGKFDAPPDQATIDGILARHGLEPASIAANLPDVFCVVEAIEPETRFRFRWIPYGLDAGLDPEREPKTLVELALADEGKGTRVRVTESGFDRVPVARRRRAFLMNTGGWAAQLDNLARYVKAAA